MMKRFFCLIFLFVVGFGLKAQQVRSTKRGVAYGDNSAKDLETLSKSVSWWYNWYYQPEASVINVYDDYGFDYVPMAWTSSFNKTGMHDFLQAHSGVKYILGWNEPNFLEQANLKPSEAAAHWSDIEDLADEFDLKIVSPAVNYCGGCVSENGVTYTDPIKYLDDFFAACIDCRVDYIAIHCYMGQAGSMEWYVGQFKKYGKPIWLTEFCSWEGSPTLQNQKDYMLSAVDYLESDPDVFRYAWFTARFNNVSPYIGLLSSTPGELTDLGKIFVNMPVHNPEAFQTIPAKIEAENYTTQSGITLKLTDDVAGFTNVADINKNDWFEYNIDVPEAGTYYFSARIASTDHGSIKLTVGETEVETLDFNNSDLKWATYTVPVTLQAGQQTFRIESVDPYTFSVNWIRFSSELIMAVDKDEEITGSEIYPNPVSDKLYIKSPNHYSLVEIADVCGRQIYKDKPTEVIDTKNFSTGPFIVRLTKHNGELVTKKIVKAP
jgi:hypothetical protein